MDTEAKPSVKKEPTISNLVEGLPRLKLFESEMDTFEEKFFISTIPVVDKATYIGIEVETENVRQWHASQSPYWKITEDGSLRNSGREFISHPIRAYRVENALFQLFNQQVNEDIEFTDRTSIHVHINIRTLTVKQLNVLLLTYLIFERSFFRFIGFDRDENIFCVPLLTTDFGTNLKSILNNEILDVHWMKYTALNLCPIYQKGTLEFRHMHGTKDISLIIQWINFILCLKKFALRKDPEYILDQIANLNTSSNYHMFSNEVFREHHSILWNDTSPKEMEEGITYIKTRCLRNLFLNMLQGHGIDSTSKLIKFKPQNSWPTQEEVTLSNADAWIASVNTPAFVGEQPTIRFQENNVRHRPEETINALGRDQINDTLTEAILRIENPTIRGNF